MKSWVWHSVFRLFLVLFFCGQLLVAEGQERKHGWVGLRPLPRDKSDHKANHGGSWAGTPTYSDQKGAYPFVAEHLDVVKGWLDGDFQTKRMFMEHYWGLGGDRDHPDPEKNLLIKQIRKWEEAGGTVEHILLCREYRLAINRGHKNARPGPFQEDTRILYPEDIKLIRKIFKDSHTRGLTKYDDYKIMMMVEHPSFFATDKRVKPIIDLVEGIAYEAHQFNRHWPLETGWSNPAEVIQGAKWTLKEGKDYVFYFGPIIWKGEQIERPKHKKYEPFVERKWLETYWKRGLPKQHPGMHYYLNTFPHGCGRGRPVGPESNPHSTLGFARWLIEEIKGPFVAEDGS
jgi:hypothetical protein